MRLDKHQKGDTIVEVLISMAIISLVLVISFSTSNRNTKTITDAQEHAQALHLAQRQVEFLRLHSQPGQTQINLPQQSCFAADGTASASSGPNNPCLVDADDKPTNTQPQYKILITATGVAPDLTYQVDVSWAGLVSGSTNNHVDLVYRT